MTQACGDLTSTKATLAVEMLGVSTIPSGAAGNADPESEEFKLKSVTMQDSSGKVITICESSQTFRIINRPQIICSGNLASAFEGKSFSNLTVVFDSHLTAKSRYATDIGLDLTTSTIVYPSDISIVKGKDYKFFVNVAWRNTVTRNGTADSISAPTLSVSVAD